MGFPDGWSYYKTRNIKRASGALSNWQARLMIAENGATAYRHFKIQVSQALNSTTQVLFTLISLYDENGDLFSPNNMTADNSPSPYVVTASSEYSTSYKKYYAFSTTAGSWRSNDADRWIALDIGEGNAKILRSYSIKNENNYDPISWTVYGSNDGSTWIPLHAATGQNNWSDGETRTFDILCLEGHAKTDFGDLRFSNSANGPLDYFIDHVTGTTPNQVAYVDVEIDSVATSDTQVKCWYGNSSATSESSSANTFIVGDDFERGNDGDAVGGDWTVATGTCELDTAQAYGGTRSFRAVGSVGGGGLATIPMTAASGEYAIQVWMRKQDAAWASLLAHGDGAKRLSLFANTSEDITTHDGSTYNDTGANSTNDTWQLYEVNNIDFSAGTFDVYQDNSLIKSGATMATSSANEDNIRIGCGSFAADVWHDNMVVRNWRATPPEWQGDGWSAEQTYSGGEVTGPAGIKSVNGILSAAIKSRNTTAWSAIKALNN